MKYTNLNNLSTQNDVVFTMCHLLKEQKFNWFVEDKNKQ